MPRGRELPLGEFMKQLAALLAERGIQMPFRDEKPWHMLFFRLKQHRESEGRPRFFDELRFDWDGPYPRCQELSDFMRALHWSSNISVSNPSFETLTLSSDVKELWAERRNSLDDEGRQFLQEAFRLAGDAFQEDIA